MRTFTILVSLAISAAACVETPDDSELGREAATAEGTPLPSIVDDEPVDEDGLLYLPRCSGEPPDWCPPGTHVVCYLGEYQCW